MSSSFHPKTYLPLSLETSLTLTLPLTPSYSHSPPPRGPLLFSPKIDLFICICQSTAFFLEKKRRGLSSLIRHHSQKTLLRTLFGFVFDTRCTSLYFHTLYVGGIFSMVLYLHSQTEANGFFRLGHVVIKCWSQSVGVFFPSPPSTTPLVQASLYFFSRRDKRNK